MVELLVLVEFGEAAASSVLSQVAAALASAPDPELPSAAVEPHQRSQQLSETLRSATRSGSLVLERRTTRTEGEIDTLAAFASDAIDAALAAERELTFIAVKVVDQDGEPIAGEPVQIELPDGRVKQGLTDKNGELLIDGLLPGGQAKISLPEVKQPGQAQAVDLDHFVEIELLDEDGDPVAGEPFTLKDPGGTVHRGVLDARGSAFISPVPKGDCLVNFGPDAEEAAEVGRPAPSADLPEIPDEEPTPGVFVVRIVDEQGGTVDGVGLTLTLAGEKHALQTSDGEAKVESDEKGPATLEFADIEALRRAFTERWRELDRKAAS